MKYLMCSVGRRSEFLKVFRKSMSSNSKLIATDNSPYAPALYFADQQYLVPRIDDPSYVDTLLEICKKERINAVMTFIDPEIIILAENREKFAALGVEVLAPYTQTAKLAFDKYEMYKYLLDKGINTVRTWGTLAEFDDARERGEIDFPVFVKPRTGSGSVGAHRVDSYEMLTQTMRADPTSIIQELMICPDLDADVYVDTISHQAVAVFSKRKIETRIGGASKTISFIDEKLFDFIQKIVSVFRFNGPIDMDFFYKDGEYYLSEVNPRFGGAYLHAYGAGVDFIKMIEKNLRGEANEKQFGAYDEGVVMMMYDSVVICKLEDLVCQRLGKAE